MKHMGFEIGSKIACTEKVKVSFGGVLEELKINFAVAAIKEEIMECGCLKGKRFSAIWWRKNSAVLSDKTQNYVRKRNHFWLKRSHHRFWEITRHYEIQLEVITWLCNSWVKPQDIRIYMAVELGWIWSRIKARMNWGGQTDERILFYT